MGGWRALLLVMLLAGLATPAIAAPEMVFSPNVACGSQDPSFVDDDVSSGFVSPCATPPGALAVETLYYQNASRVGGTALAAYPLVRFRTGVARNLELVLDPPSQIAESGEGGIGVYPITRFGYGLNYTLTSSVKSASSLGVELQPPSSLFNVNERQPKYIFDYVAAFHVSQKVTLSAIATGASSRVAGFERIAPAAAIRAAFAADPRTQIATDIGERMVAKNSRLQQFGDLSVSQRLRRNINYTIGIGTTFNGFTSVGKAHYLASGFNVHLK